MTTTTTTMMTFEIANIICTTATHSDPTRPDPRETRPTGGQWLKWLCEAGGSPDEARLEQTPYPFHTQLILRYLGITYDFIDSIILILYSYIAGGGSNRSRGLSPPPLNLLTLTTAGGPDPRPSLTNSRRVEKHPYFTAYPAITMSRDSSSIYTVSQ